MSNINSVKVMVDSEPIKEAFREDSLGSDEENNSSQLAFSKSERGSLRSPSNRNSTVNNRVSMDSNEIGKLKEDVVKFM